MKKILLVTILSVVLLGLVGGWFYWFEWRPLEIRKDCNWIEKTAGGNDEPDYSNIQGSPAFKIKDGSVTSDRTENWKAAGSPMKHVPVSKYWKKATDDEYKQCLRLKGLK